MVHPEKNITEKYCISNLAFFLLSETLLVYKILMAYLKLLINMVGLATCQVEG